MSKSQGPRRPGRPKIETLDPVDVRVGSRLRLRRNMLGMSQAQLGEAIGLTSQQIHKYERGTSQIGASRLHEFSRILNIPISFFFDDTDPVPAAQMTGYDTPIDLANFPNTVALIQACEQLEPAVLHELYLLALAIVKAQKTKRR